MTQMLLYDDEGMRIYDVTNFVQDCAITDVIEARTIEQTTYCQLIPRMTYDVKISIGEVKAELDPTTMKRIAKYNLEKDFEELNQQIKSAEERLKLLNEQIETQEEKAGFIRELTHRIWNDPCFDQDNYLPDEDENYAEDGWE